MSHFPNLVPAIRWLRFPSKSPIYCSHSPSALAYKREQLGALSANDDVMIMVGTGITSSSGNTITGSVAFFGNWIDRSGNGSVAYAFDQTAINRVAFGYCHFQSGIFFYLGGGSDSGTTFFPETDTFASLTWRDCDVAALETRIYGTQPVSTSGNTAGCTPSGSSVMNIAFPACLQVPGRGLIVGGVDDNGAGPAIVSDRIYSVLA